MKVHRENVQTRNETGTRSCEVLRRTRAICRRAERRDCLLQPRIRACNRNFVKGPISASSFSVILLRARRVGTRHQQLRGWCFSVCLVSFTRYTSQPDKFTRRAAERRNLLLHHKAIDILIENSIIRIQSRSDAYNGQSLQRFDADRNI